jgi:3-dehydrosphinganine reductase
MTGRLLPRWATKPDGQRRGAVMEGQRHALITGGSHGLGRSFGALLAVRGFRVSLVARGATDLDAAAAEMQGDVRWQAADVTDRADLGDAVLRLVEQSGPVDLLLAAAGAARAGYFVDLEDQVFRDQMALNYFGVLNAIRAVTPSMIERRTGDTVAVASTAAILGVYGYAAYTPSNYYVPGLGSVST